MSFKIIEFWVLKMTMKDNVSLKMTSNAFGIHWSASSKVIHDVFLAIVKHLASKSVQSASFTVLKSSSVPKSSYFYIFLSVIMFKTLKFSVLLKSSQFICPCKLFFFSSILHLYCVCHFFLEEPVQSKFPRNWRFVYMGLRMRIIVNVSENYLTLVLHEQKTYLSEISSSGKREPALPGFSFIQLKHKNLMEIIVITGSC